MSGSTFGPLTGSVPYGVIGPAAGGVSGGVAPTSVVGTPSAVPINTASPENFPGSSTTPGAALTETTATPNILSPTATATSPAASILGPTDLYNALQSMDAQIQAAMVPNALNSYYQPSYHFRLYVAGDQDILTQAGQTAAPLSAAQQNLIAAQNDLASRDSSLQTYSPTTGLPNFSSVPQVTIAETGITGWNIKEVTINTLLPGNEISGSQIATNFAMTIIDPLGVNFLDGFVAAAKQLNMADYTKAIYYIELSFTGYNQSDASYAGRPITGFPNGGIWTWAVTPTYIKTKIDEGGGTFNTEFIIREIAPQTNAAEGGTSGGQVSSAGGVDYSTLPSALIVSGVTVKDIFSDFVTKLNALHAYNSGTTLVSFQPIKTEPITFNVANATGKDPGTFKLKPQAIEQSPKRTWDMTTVNGNVTFQIQKGTSIYDFLISVINNTEEGHALAKDNPTISQTNQTKGYRESITFIVEQDVKVTGHDAVSGIYIKQITLRIAAHYATKAPVLDRNQITSAQDPNNQQKMIQALLANKSFQKRYDYIYTGDNTEVLNFDIGFKFPFSSTISQLAGANYGLDNLATNAKLNAGNTKPTGTLSEALIDLSNSQSISSFITNLSNDISAIGTGISNGITNVTTSITSGITTAIAPITSSFSQLTSSLPNLTGFSGASNNPVNAITNSITSKLGAPTTATPQVNLSNGNNIYIEDILSTPNSVIGSNNTTIPNPITISQGNVGKLAGNGAQGQYHRDKSIVGSIFAQIYTDPLVAEFKRIELEIRGDPYWLGQTNLERQLSVRNETPSNNPNAFPDFGTLKPVFELFFRYPIQIGNDFKPVLLTSESFNGLYQAVGVEHKFSEGKFTQTLTAQIITLASLNNSYIGNPSAKNGGPSSSGNHVSIPSSSTPSAPVTGLPPGNHWQQAVQNNPTDFQTQAANTQSVGDIPPAVYAQYLATMSYGEATNDPSQINSLNYVGLYQMGYGALQTAGVVTAGSQGTSPYTWTINPDNPYGITSMSDFLSNPVAQTAAFTTYNQSNYNAMVLNGVITPGMPIEQQLGYMGAAQLSGPGGPSNPTKGAYGLTNGYIVSDGNTSNANYYNLGQAAAAKVTGNTTYIPYQK